MIACSKRKLLMQVCVSFQCEQTIVHQFLPPLHQLIYSVMLIALNVIQWVVVHIVPVDSIRMGVAVVSVYSYIYNHVYVIFWLKFSLSLIPASCL